MPIVSNNSFIKTLNKRSMAPFALPANITNHYAFHTLNDYLIVFVFQIIFKYLHPDISSVAVQVDVMRRVRKKREKKSTWKIRS